MIVAKLSYLLGGIAVGCAATVAVFLWGARPVTTTIICLPEGVKSDAMCEIVQDGRMWSLSSGYYLHVEHAYPKFEEAIGPDCARRHREYLVSFADGIPSPNSFFCINRGSS
jgi:hypothetical protein